MHIAFIGLGNMGTALAQNALNHKHHVYGYNRSPEKTKHLKQKAKSFHDAYSLEDLIQNLKPPRIIWLMLAVGQPIEDTLFGGAQESLNSQNPTSNPGLIDLLEPNDIIIDGANSFYRDSQRRAKHLANKGIHYLDCGTSGGVKGAKEGASLMIGGHQDAFHTAEPLFKSLAKPNGYAYFGPSGAGHFVKMVHNGIEYGIMQAIAEGAAILQASEFKPDLNLATQVWSNGSIIESSLIKWLHQITTTDKNLDNVEPTIGSLGTGKWTAQTALELGIPAHVITAAVNARYESRPESTFSRKVVQALREHFGNHNTQERDAH